MATSVSAPMPTIGNAAAMNGHPYRILAIASHPVQYMSPIFRRMAKDRRFDLHVAYCSLRGAEAGMDPEFGATVQWDVPLLDGYPWTHVLNAGSGSESFWGLRNPGLGKLIREGGFDAVLCYVSYRRASFWIAYRAAKASSAAFLFGTDTTTLEPLDQRKWKRYVKRAFWPFLFRLATQVMVPSSGTRDLMLSLGISPKRISLTPYVVDNDWWRTHSASVDKQEMRKSWKASRGDLVVLFCAKLQPWKRPMDLLQAFAMAQLSRSVLVFAGEGPLRAEVERMAATLGISERVRFLGFVNQSQLPAVYAGADLMVLPSSYDAFGVVVNEALLCGCAVAVSDKVGAGRDLIAPIVPEFIYGCGNVPALAAILRKAHDDRSWLASIVEAEQKHLESWSPRENISGQFEAVKQALAHLGR